ncbi:MAG: hypothetical protein JNK74_26200 [Candidatus Hydrogenedentes bacterium]|nr:hypothetical protein [Candidatus Hydrogenedentota bacterium]
MRFIGLVVIFLAAVTASAGPVTRIEWEENILALHAPEVPGGKVETWYLEAFCRSGSTDRDWEATVIPHTTRLVEADGDGQWVKLESMVQEGVRATHEIRVVEDGVSFALVIKNESGEAVDVDWAQPCMRVGDFTGLGQEDYFSRCFIYTRAGQVMLDRLPRVEEARYRGGQVYVPAGVDLDDVNPRPISKEVPVNNLIGCVSSDGRWILATAWDATQELFQGVINCIHADPRIGGLKAGEAKRITGRVYLVPNDSEGLLAAYERDFGK